MTRDRHADDRGDADSSGLPTRDTDAPLSATELAVARLKASEELNRRIIAAVPGGVLHVAQDGAIRTANEEACRFLGLSYDALAGKYTTEVDWHPLHEDGTPYEPEEHPVFKVLATGEATGPVTIGVQRPSGQRLWAVLSAVPVQDMDGHFDGAVVTFLDITDRRQAEERVKASEAKLRSMLESTPAVIFTTDIDGRIQQINKILPELSPEQVMGTPVTAFADPRDVQTILDAMRRARETGEVVGYEAGGPPEIDPSRYSVRIAPVTVGEEVVGFTFNALDITEQKRMQHQLMISDRMASVGTLAAGVAHEINNPLAFLAASVTHAKRQIAKLGPRAELRRILERLEEATEGVRRIADVVRDLGTFSRSEDTGGEVVEVRPVLESAIRMAHNELRYRAKVVREYGDPPRVFANSSRLGQVFLNLVVNAGQAIREGDVDHNRVTVRTSRDGDGWAVVQVEDTGPGIDLEVAGRIFDPFVTTKMGSTGTGLGLYICHNIVTSVGGRIRAENLGTGGARFTVSLPPAPKGRVPAQEPTRTVPQLGRLKVLIVDDEALLRKTIAFMLSDHEVDEAASGDEALEKLQNTVYDVIVCDLVMPNLTGMDLFEQLRQRRSEMASRIVFMTGGAFTKHARDFVENANRIVLHKPFSESQLMNAIAATLRSQADGA